MKNFKKRLAHWWEGHDWWFVEKEDFFLWLGRSGKRECKLVFRCRVCGKLKKGFADNLDAYAFACKVERETNDSIRGTTMTWDDYWGTDIHKLALEELNQAVYGTVSGSKEDFPQLSLDIC